MALAEQVVSLRQSKQVTLEEFEELCISLEYEARHIEWIHGEVVEVPSNLASSMLGIRLAGLIFIYLQTNKIGRLSGEAGGYFVGPDVYAPDLAFLSYARQAEISSKGFNKLPPDLAIEIISNPTSSHEQTVLRYKLSAYLAADSVVWIIDPYARQVQVHQPGKPPIGLSETDTLTGGDVLPGFSLPLENLFADFPKSEQES